MKEKTTITILVIVLVLLGLISLGMDAILTKFTFSSSILQVNGNNITETLTYMPSNGYHTFYRNFVTPIDTYSDNDYISMTNVECSDGTPYYKDYNNRLYSPSASLSYTESNEYGCGFGETLGFLKGKKYTITGEYVLNPTFLFDHKGQKYIKFVLYTKGNHPLLITGKNFKLYNGVLSKRFYLASEDVIVYVPYNPTDTSRFDIESMNTLAFAKGYIWKIIIVLIPALICLLSWIKFGKENIEGDYPEELSQYPKERKAWEVAAYFHPPFGQVGGTLLPAVILEFYDKKIIDIKNIGKKSYIKILHRNQKIDDVEAHVLNFLEVAEKQSDTKDGYFNLDDINKSQVKAYILHKEYAQIEKVVRYKSDEYIDKTGVLVAIISIMIMIILVVKIHVGGYIIASYFISLFIMIIMALKTSLFSKFKKDYYKEYQQWQGFRNYLATLYSMKEYPPQGVVLWDKYLIYATSLGIGKRVLEALKKWKIINDKQYNSFHSISTSTFIGSTNTESGGSGGFSGGGGGGMGGGGGGGR